MKTLTTLLSLLMLLAVSTATAQTDSTAATTPDSTKVTKSDISIRVGDNKGARVEVQTYDSITGERMDTTKFSMGKSTIIIVNDENYVEEEEKSPKQSSRSKRHELTHWDGLDVGWNTFMDANGNYGPGEGNEYLELNEWGSRYIALNFGETKVRLIKDYVGIYTGVGFQIYNFKLRNDSSLAFNNDTLIAFGDPSIQSFKKNKFRSSWIVVPLMLEFNTSNSQSNNFHLAAGVVGGYNLGNMYKQKIKRDGSREKIKDKGEWLVEDFKLDAALRVGYKEFALTASYQLTSLFEENKGPDVRMASLGFAMYFD